MDKEYLIDSNAIIDYLAGKYPLAGKTFMNSVVNKTPVLSVISKIEILGFSTTREAESLIEDFVTVSYIFPLTDTIVEKTIELRKSIKIKLPDAIIAATCLASDLILITHNIKDFMNIPDLKIIDPYMTKYTES